MKPPIERVLDRIVLDENNCWIWTGAKTGAGYGNIGTGSTKDDSLRWRNCHRVTYEYFRGPVPEGLQLDHLCRVRACANPWHLEPVTNRENSLRGEHPNAQIRRSGFCKRGHPLVEGNIYYKKNGTRTCLTCRRAIDARKRDRRRWVMCPSCGQLRFVSSYGRVCRSCASHGIKQVRDEQGRFA